MNTNTNGSCIHEFHIDEIPTCPMCGLRTEPTEFVCPNAEEHHCDGCGYEFVVEYVEEDHDQDG